MRRLKEIDRSGTGVERVIRLPLFKHSKLNAVRDTSFSGSPVLDVNHNE